MADDDNQYAYLLVRSDVLSPDELTARIGIEPTEIKKRGSRRAGPPPVPRTNIWKHRPAGPPGLQLSLHLDALRSVIASHAPALRALVDEDIAVVTLEIVRTVSAVAEHDHLGFGLDRGLLSALADAGAEVDVDEYSDSGPC